MQCVIESGQMREISTTGQVSASAWAIRRPKQAPWDPVPVREWRDGPAVVDREQIGIGPRLTASRNGARGDEQT